MNNGTSLGISNITRFFTQIWNSQGVANKKIDGGRGGCTLREGIWDGEWVGKFRKTDIKRHFITHVRILNELSSSWATRD